MTQHMGLSNDSLRLSNDSLTELNPALRPLSDLTRPRKHARRTSLPVARGQATSSNGSEGVDIGQYNAERRRFREAAGVGLKSSSSTSRRRESMPAAATNGSVQKPKYHSTGLVEETESDTDSDGIDASHSTVASSTNYAAGPSRRGSGAGSDDVSSSDASSSDRVGFDWDTTKKKSIPAYSTTISSTQQRRLLGGEAYDMKKSQRESYQGRHSIESSQPDTPTLPKKELDSADETPRGSSTAIARSGLGIPARVNGSASPSGGNRFPSANGVEPNTGAGARRTTKSTRRKLFVSSAIELGTLIAAAGYSCYLLWEHPDDAISQHQYEMIFVVATSSLYCFLRSPGENACIWATDERNYRPCGDDGAICGLLLGPLLAITCLFTSLSDQPSRRRFASGDSLALPPWNVESPQQILGTRTVPHSSFTALTLSRCTLLSLQTLASITFLCHLLATKWIRKPSDLPASNWKKLWSFIKFSLSLSTLLAAAREIFLSLHIPIWTNLSRSELVVSTLLFQCNLYTISRLARKSFTLGELGIVSTVGVTLCLEMLNLTTARMFPASTPFVKTFRRPTPLLVFQLAMVVGTFTIGFLLSPLLYLSRHLAQKPVHRLRWPHKRDLHRRLLAGFFFAFAALYVVGVLGLWVWWMLGKRNPWMWTMHFVLQGKHWWSRPLLIGYWLVLVSISVSGWQASRLVGKRIRIRPAGASHNGQQVAIVPSESADSNSKSKGVPAHPTHTDAVVPNGSLGLPKRAAYLSLNARRKFFHALAVLLFTPGIAYDPAFSHLAFSLAFSAFIFAEYIRYYALHPFGAALHVFMSEFTDHKDSGPVILSHFYLLTGCASAIWLEGGRAGSHLSSRAETAVAWPWSRVASLSSPMSSKVDISMFIGVLTLGVGDALASIVGRRYGRSRWPGSSKTLEGSLAFVLSIFATSLLLRGIGWCAPFSITRFGIVTMILGVLEGASNQNDNLVLPIFGVIALSLLNV